MNDQHLIDFGNGFVTVPAPDNFESAEADVIFTKDKARASLANLTLVWKGDTARKIFAVYESGKSGGKGVSSALPYKIQICGTTLALDLMLVMGHSSARFSCDEVHLPAWAAQGIDWFEQETNAYPFWHLYKNLKAGDKGKINFSDFKKTPYTINSIPNYTQVVSLTFQELVLLWQLKTMWKTFRKDATNLTTTVSAAGVPITGTEHILIVVGRVGNLVLEGAQITLYLILIGKFMAELKKNIIQSKKYKLCMREKDLWLKMCEFLGLTFSSSTYAQGSKYENATWMPSKITIPNIPNGTVLNNFIASMYLRPEDEAQLPSFANKSVGYFEGRFSQFVAAMEAKYNSEVKIINGTLVFEGINSFNTQGAYMLPNTAEDTAYTFNLPAPFRTNLSELAPYYEVHFQIDDSDRNTVHRYKGTSAAVKIQTSFPINKYSGWGEGEIIDLGSALAKRKDFLTREEEFFNNINQIIYDIVNIIILPFNIIIAAINAIISVINAICKLFGIGGVKKIPAIKNPINLSAINSRIGWMELSDDTFSSPKSFIGVDVGGDWELHPNTEADMSAISLLNDKHSTNFATRGNQWLIYENNRTKFCCADYQAVNLKNVFQVQPGKFGKFDTLKWNLKADSAKSIQYRIKETFLTGLSEQIIIDGTP